MKRVDGVREIQLRWNKAKRRCEDKKNTQKHKGMGLKSSLDSFVNCIHFMKFFGPLQKDKQATILFSAQQPGAEDSKC